MPVLNWIGKDKVVNHDKELPFRVLKPIKEESVGEDSENLLIEGDNLEALKALMPFYYSKVKCIYIDPPYNTGNESWAYNDKVNSAHIKKWLHEIVGIEDLERHDKWLCMMYPRLKLLHDLLSDDGVIFISIDDNEINNLRLIMDEIFGSKNFIATIIAQINPRGRSLDRFLAKTHEYILLYAKNIDNDNAINLIQKEGASLNTYNKKDNKGIHRELELRNRNPVFSRKNRPNLYFPIYVDPDTGSVTLIKDDMHPEEVFPLNSKNEEGCWTWSKDKVTSELKNLTGKKVSTGVWRIYRKDYLYDEEGNESLAKAKAIWLESMFNNENGKEVMRKIFGGDSPFDYPKSVDLIQYCLELGSDKDSIVLDSFAGSGTTGHAVLELNKQDGGKRKFILVELERDIAKKITAKRLEKVIKGYEDARFPEGTGQGFQYLDLNGELYGASGFVNPNAQYEDMAAYIYFTETKNYLDVPTIKKPYIGSLGSNHYFLFFEGKDENILDVNKLKQVEEYKGNKIVYADKCLVDEEVLSKRSVIFKQIPYELKKY
jgi:adenine-specific DNA-methyltransferase